MSVTTSDAGASSADLSGANMGMVASSSVTSDGSPLGAVTVTVLDVHETSGGALAPLGAAVNPN